MSFRLAVVVMREASTSDRARFHKVTPLTRLLHSHHLTVALIVSLFFLLFCTVDSGTLRCLPMSHVLCPFSIKSITFCLSCKLYFFSFCPFLYSHFTFSPSGFSSSPPLPAAPPEVAITSCLIPPDTKLVHTGQELPRDCGEEGRRQVAVVWAVYSGTAV